MSIRNAAKAIIMHDGKILLNQCISQTPEATDGVCMGESYYALPGGGQNPYETIEEAVQRECMEETGYNVSVDRLAAIYEEIIVDPDLRKAHPDYTHKVYFVFLCHLSSEVCAAPTERDQNQIGFEWIDAACAPELPILPRTIGSNLMGILQSESITYFGSMRID